MGAVAHIQFDEKERLYFELLISEISSNLVHPGFEIDSVIEESLQKILDFLGLDRAILWQLEGPDSKRFIITHMKIRPGCGPQEKPLFLTSDSFPWITSEILNGRESQYSRIDDLPEEAAIDKETLRGFGPQYSALAVPLVDGDIVYGILTLGIAEEMLWPKELTQRLRVVAHVFSSALLRRNAETNLRNALTELEKAKNQLELENVYLREEMKVRNDHNIVYQSQVMSDVLGRVGQVARTNATVLLTGETGTGKELIAAAIHQASTRSKRPMVRVNCGAIPSALVESEMFGREKGAYTGALTRQIGRFELAHESTIFLDEITDLPMDVQVKLLRVLQEKEIERLGNPNPIHVDVRVIAATNQKLEKAVQEGKFREDLYYRLNVFPIDIPPLRDRREDIPMLVWSFVDQLSTEFGKKVESISRKSMEALGEYSWPGNVRELRNTIERAMIVLNSSKLYIELPKIAPYPTSISSTEVMTLKDIEVQHIRKVLENVGWKIRGTKGAAQILGMKPTTLETRMSKLGIIRPNSRIH